MVSESTSVVNYHLRADGMRNSVCSECNRFVRSIIRHWSTPNLQRFNQELHRHFNSWNLQKITLMQQPVTLIRWRLEFSDRKCWTLLYYNVLLWIGCTFLLFIYCFDICCISIYFNDILLFIYGVVLLFNKEFRQKCVWLHPQTWFFRFLHLNTIEL